MKNPAALFASLLLGMALVACENSDAALPSAQSAVESARQAAHQTGDAFKQVAVAATTETRELVEKARSSRVGEKTADILTETGAKTKEIFHMVAEKARYLGQKAKEQVAIGSNSAGR